MSKKRIIIIVAIVLFIMTLIPFSITRYKDGGSVEYKALLYKYTKIHRLNEISFTGYEDGWKLEILGIMTFGNTDVDIHVKHNENNEQKSISSIILEVKEDTRTRKGATFVIKNNTNDEYSYGPIYTIEKFENNSWKEINTLTGDPLTWNSVIYKLKPGEEKELYIDWSLGYGELKSGTYRLVKSDLRKSKNPESRTYTVYAEFDIK